MTIVGEAGQSDLVRILEGRETTKTISVVHLTEKAKKPKELLAALLEAAEAPEILLAVETTKCRFSYTVAAFSVL